MAKQFSISSLCFLAFLFPLFNACYKILILPVVVTMMSSNIWACQSSESVSELLPGGVLTSDFWTTRYCLLPLGILLIFLLHLWSKPDFHLNDAVIEFVAFSPFYNINLLCMWHFELTEYNIVKIDHTGNTPSEKKGCITWSPYAFYCR